MIHFNCPSCGQHYHVPVEKAGVKAKCKKCGGVMTVPQPAEAGAGEAAHNGVSEHAASPHPAASHAGSTGAGDFDHAAANINDDRSVSPGAHRRRPAADRLPGRPYSGAEEIEVRKRNLIILGVLLLVGFIMPSCAGGPGGSQITIINIQGLFEGRAPIGLKLLLIHPLIAGILCCMAGTFRPQVRGIINIVSGLLPFALLFAAVPARVQADLGDALSGPGGLGGAIGLLLSVLSLYGIFIGCRLRWYRPLLYAAYIVAVIGAAASIISLIIPDPMTGDIGLTGPFRAMEMDFVIGLGALIWFICLIGTSILIFVNTPATEPTRASQRAHLAFWIYIGGIIAMVALIAFRSMGAAMGPGAGGMGLMIFGIFLKIALWFGATIALFPMGVIDVVLDEPVAKIGLCQACGYDLRGAPSATCPECGHVN